MQEQTRLASRNLRIKDKNYTGSLSWIHEIPATDNPEKVLGLISGQQLVASGDGRYVAFLVRTAQGLERVDHNLSSVPRLQLMSGYGSRILQVNDREIIVFGKPNSTDKTGVYRIDRKGIHLIEPLSEICLQNQSSPFVVVGRSENASELSVLSSTYSFTASSGTRIVFLEKSRVMLLESMSGTTYRYCVNQDGFIEDWSRVPKDIAANPFALVKRGAAFFLATANQSRLFPLNDSFAFPQEGVSLRGQLESFWQSPNQQSLAWLVSLPESIGPARRLYVDGTLMFEGVFELQQKDLTWSPNGKQFGALIKQMSSTGITEEFIVTPTVIREISPEQKVQEFLIDNSGSIAAVIVKSGRFVHPAVYMRPHDAVPIAWNLSWTANGGIKYNSALTTSSSVVLMRTEDETHIVR